MSKKLNIIEAMKMPVGTLFEVIHERKGPNATNVILDMDYDNKFLRWKDGGTILMTSDNLFAVFIPIQQPVSFMDVVGSDKRCSVEFDNCMPTRYESFRDIILILIDSYGESGLKKAIKLGKWYIEN
jgi:hypothetical protein